MVNIDEQIGKTVGQRKAGDPLVVAPGDRARKREMQQAGFFPRFPKGVFKFNSFEEADAWMMRYMTSAEPEPTSRATQSAASNGSPEV